MLSSFVWLVLIVKSVLTMCVQTAVSCSRGWQLNIWFSVRPRTHTFTLLKECGHMWPWPPPHVESARFNDSMWLRCVHTCPFVILSIRMATRSKQRWRKIGHIDETEWSSSAALKFRLKLLSKYSILYRHSWSSEDESGRLCWFPTLLPSTTSRTNVHLQVSI